MNKYYVSQISVKGLWGRRSLKIHFNKDMNIVIGPNASGKTTLINMLHCSLTANLIALSQVAFTEIRILLHSFDGNETAEVEVRQTDESTTIAFDGLTMTLPSGPWRLGRDLSDPLFAGHPMRRRVNHDLFRIRESVTQQVPAVWLPVSRRLPIADEEEAERRRLHRTPLESVDECLEGLLESLQRYRVSLDSDLSELRKDFQKHALETILYDKQHDKLPDSWSLTPPSQDEKQQLLQAFADVGFSDNRIKKRIEEHFAAAEEAVRTIGAKSELDIRTLFIVPLINRTKSMVQFAQELEHKRTSLFASLHSYENIVNSFLSDKTTTVTDKGLLTITPKQQKHAELEWRHLSSGEKQILILLTQSLIWERDPVVYVADEPELSLHVTWQEKLLSSLSKLAGRCQFIVATHSPDIVSGFGNKVIDLAKL